MSVKNIVKVMNFHSLLRVDSSRRKAEKYFMLETVIEEIIDNILNNKNFIHDKKIMLPDQNLPELDIFIGSDYGFCGNYNMQVSRAVKQYSDYEEKDSQMVVVGKKIYASNRNNERIILELTKDEAINGSEAIQDILIDSVMNRKHSKINIIFNYYEDITNISFLEKTIYPTNLEDRNPNDDYTEDFVLEGDVNELLAKLIACYITYELKISLLNSYASENIMRQNVTRESLRKIEELEEIAEREFRKEKRARDFRKQIEKHIQQTVK